LAKPKDTLLHMSAFNQFSPRPTYLSKFWHLSRLFSNALFSMKPHGLVVFLSFRLHSRLFRSMGVHMSYPILDSLLTYLSLLETPWRVLF
jgi:hypothetical protein